MTPERKQEQQKFLEEYRMAVLDVHSPWPKTPDWIGTDEWITGLKELGYAV